MIGGVRLGRPREEVIWIGSGLTVGGYGGYGDAEIDATTDVVSASEGEVSTATSVASKVRRKKIASDISD